VGARGGLAVLPWRDAYLAAIAAGLAAQPTADGIPVGAYRQAIVHLQKGRAATLADVASAWRLLAPGGRLLVCGDNDLGIATFLKRISDDLGPAEPLANRAHGRIACFLRSERPPPQAPPPASVPLLPEAARAEPGGGVMLSVTPGVFSADGLDGGTAALLGCLSQCPPPGRVLDLGCGAGHLAIAALVRWPRSVAVLADGDHRAVTCASANLAALGLSARAQVAWWDAREHAPARGIDLALVNPPFHTGHAVDLAPAKAMFRALGEALAPGGRALVVANRTLPYERDLSAFGRVHVARQDSGFKVIQLLHE
jgi:16S rRNA (guanine1207-N2)-methyltransferase